jgi:hypothetical protein
MGRVVGRTKVKLRQGGKQSPGPDSTKVVLGLPVAPPGLEAELLLIQSPLAQADISDNLLGFGHLPSIGARIPAVVCPLMPGETTAKLRQLEGHRRTISPCVPRDSAQRFGHSRISSHGLGATFALRLPADSCLHATFSGRVSQRLDQAWTSAFESG